MSLQTFSRTEKKFLLNARQSAELTKRLPEYMIYDSHCRDGGYQILNVYFDTAGSDVIRRSVSKPYYKEKLRLRSYGVPKDENAKVFLELKRKIGGIVNKRRAVLAYGDALKYIDSFEKPKTLDYENAQVLEEIDRFRKVNPVLPDTFISYDRIAMFGKEDNTFRLTIDCNIQARRENVALAAGAGGRQLLGAGEKLLEVKIDGAIPLWLAKLLSELRIYSRSFSKIGTEYNTRREYYEYAV